MNLTIDNKKVNFDTGASILDAAVENDINIPTLCAHPELSPYGGCRLCAVEIEGRKGYPAACTTPAEEGMIVRTDTKKLQEIRTELIQLILSEHPAACLICEDVDGCTGYQETIRKVGITTGCRWCPKDQDCDFQRIVESLNVKDLTLPGLYRDQPLEKFDPFYDRDYNLCIYCGKCVRICDEVRKSSVLALKQRGKETTIGPAFDASHIEANCEFCGACVSVCPTGAMSEKSRKWWGVPDSSMPSVCPLCSMNCDLQVLSLKDNVVGTAPPGKLHESGGELCVKGRFCLSEILNRTPRILEPEFKYEEGYGIVSWEKAVNETVEIIANAKPGRSAVVLSPGLTLEEISLASQFAREVLDTDLITSSFVDSSMLRYMRLARKSVSLEEFRKANFIVSLFLNGNYRYAPLTMAIKDLAAKGIPYFQVGWVLDTTSRFADEKIIPVPGKEIECLDRICSQLKKNKKGVVVVGPELLSLSNHDIILNEIEKIIAETGSDVFMPNPFGNLDGFLSIVNFCVFKDVQNLIDKGKIDLLYLVGDVPFDERPEVNKIIYQNAFPTSTGLGADIILPAALWSESGGSYLDMFGKIKRARTASNPHGYALSHQEIFRRISKSLKRNTPKTSLKNIKEQIGNRKSLSVEKEQIHNPLKFSENGHPFVLIVEEPQHVYHNLDLGEGVEGFRELAANSHLIINPKDAGKLGIENGDTVEVKSGEKGKELIAELRKTIIPGHVLLSTSLDIPEFESNPCMVKINKKDV